MSSIAPPPGLSSAGTLPQDIWYTVCPVPSAASIAFARGEYASEFEGTGVTLNSIRSHPDRKIREAHYDQSHENLFREGGNIPPIVARSKGRNLRIIGLSWIEHYSRILALPGSGIQNPGDLKGKRLGLIKRPNDPVDFPRATALRGYLAALESVGLGSDDVTFVDIVLDEPLVGKPPEGQALSSSYFSARVTRKRQGPELKALITGEIDAIYQSSQAAEFEALLGAEVVADIAAFPEVKSRINNLAPVAFTVRGELLESRPDVVARYLARAIKTARWAAANPGDAKRQIARDSSIAEEWVDAAYSASVHTALEPSLTPELISLLKDQKDFLVRWGFAPHDFSVADWIAHEAIEEARRLVDAGR
ncbi:desulfurase [Kaistia sp. 32K]|uniref:ABC transporter substrate-binding protein n=1 Tax=Kaistia sp. 32K TaxID=2795690 RepID=UPI00191612DF|nr:ABC transporter substrate-binding protein [Kaistia sp. 32K]BCP54913.1 desulfurase [Kaistia sp. 32K]